MPLAKTQVMLFEAKVFLNGLTAHTFQTQSQKTRCPKQRKKHLTPSRKAAKVKRVKENKTGVKPDNHRSRQATKGHRAMSQTQVKAQNNKNSVNVRRPVDRDGSRKAARVILSVKNATGYSWGVSKAATASARAAFGMLSLMLSLPVTNLAVNGSINIFSAFYTLIACALMGNAVFMFYQAMLAAQAVNPDSDNGQGVFRHAYKTVRLADFFGLN